MEKYSLSDIAALMNGRNNYGDGFLEGNGIIILILFFLIFGFGGNGFGGWGNGGFANGALTRAEMFDGFNNQDTQRKLDGITNGLCDGFYAQNTTALQGFNSIGSAIAESRFAAQECCCTTNRNIDAVRYENAKNTCDIITNATANTQRILDVLCEDRIQTLRDKVAEQGQMLQTANFQLSQQAQNATLINALRPTPSPAYLTCSPYQSQMLALNAYGNGLGYGYNNGCGCGCGCGI